MLHATVINGDRYRQAEIFDVAPSAPHLLAKPERLEIPNDEASIANGFMSNQIARRRNLLMGLLSPMDSSHCPSCRIFSDRLPNCAAFLA